MNRKFIFLLLMVFVLLPSFSYGAMLGVNKINIKYDNVLRQGYAYDSVVISTGVENDVAVYYEARGDIADWVSFDPDNQPITINSDVPGRIGIIVQPSADTQVGVYEGKIVLSTGALGGVQGNVGANVVVAFEINIIVNVTDTQILSCSLSGFDMLDAETQRNIPFVFTSSNSGNVRVKPTFGVEVYDQDQTNLITTFAYEHNKDILPTTSERIQGEFENTLEPGQYWARISSDICDGSGFLTFSILEKGGISDLGELVRIENGAWANTGDTVPFKAYFRNRGQRTVSAEFKGVLSKDGKIVDILNSETLDVSPNELAVFDMFYQVNEPGQYKITGRVHYNNKITYEKGSVLNVNVGSLSDSREIANLSWILLLIILVIGFLIFLIIRKKKKRRFKY